MANYYSSARTNYFRVKDVGAFNAWFKEFEKSGAEAVKDARENTFAILFDQESGVPSSRQNGDDFDEIDFMSELSEHLADDEVAILQESGAEKLRYIVGYAVAINNKGERREITIHGIYDLAKELGKNVTQAEYWFLTFIKNPPFYYLMNNDMNNDLRSVVIDLLDEPNGISQAAYAKLVTFSNRYAVGVLDDVFNAADGGEGRVWLNEDTAEDFRKSLWFKK